MDTFCFFTFAVTFAVTFATAAAAAAIALFGAELIGTVLIGAGAVAFATAAAAAAISSEPPFIPTMFAFATLLLRGRSDTDALY